MKRIAFLFGLLSSVPLLAQRPAAPALLVPEAAPERDYVFAPDAYLEHLRTQEESDDERS